MLHTPRKYARQDRKICIFKTASRTTEILERGSTINSDSFESYGLFFLQGLVIHAKQAPVWCNLRKIDVLSKNMRPDLRWKLREIPVGLERVP